MIVKGSNIEKKWEREKREKDSKYLPPFSDWHGVE